MENILIQTWLHAAERDAVDAHTTKWRDLVTS